MPASLDPTYPLFSVFSFLGFVVSLIPLPWHIQAWNSGTCAFMIWTAMACLIEFTNSLVWRGNVNNPAPVWCDISSKLLIGVSIGIPASTLCISRRLYSITSVQTVSFTREDKRRLVIGDLCIAVGIPVLAMILHVVVQPHRFDILEDIGCYPAIYNTLPAYFLYFSWPVVLGLVSFVYSGLTLRSFWIRRVHFSQLLSSNPSMNPSRYLRLMLLAVVDMVFTIPLAIYSIYIANKGVGMAPWISWADTHFDFGRIGYLPAIIWRGDTSFETSVELTRWLPVTCAFLFFALFGFATEAKKHYSLVFRWVATRFGFKAQFDKELKINISLPGWKKMPGWQSTSSTTRGSIPLIISKPYAPKKLHFESFSSFGGTAVAQDTWTDIDLEKCADLSVPSPASSTPPSYSQQRPADITAAGSRPAALPRVPRPSSRACLQSQVSHPSLRTMYSHDRIYISDTYPESPRSRSPSPAPFSNTVPAPFHRPLTPPSVYPIILPHPRTQSLDVMHVLVHKQLTEAV